MAEKKTIMIIDEGENNRDMLELFLEMEGYTVYFAENTTKVLPVIREIMPDLILLDILMPNTDGVKTLEKLDKDPDLSDIPVIALTFKTASNNVVKAIRILADEYLVMPFNVVEFISKIKKLIKLKHDRDFMQSIAQKQKEHSKSFEIQFKMRIKESKVFQKQFELALVNVTAGTRSENPIAPPQPPSEKSKNPKLLISKTLKFNFCI